MSLLSHFRLPQPMTEVLYRTYERRLLHEIHEDRVPQHVGVVMDGNRRLARSLGRSPWEGHELGSRTVEALLDWAGDAGVKTLTLYAFSTENFSRPAAEVDALMEIFAVKLAELATDRRIHDRQVHVEVLGRLEMLPRPVRDAIRTAEEATAHYDRHRLNFCIAYGGRQEIIDAVRALIDKVQAGDLDPEDIDEEKLGKHLYTAGDDPDLIIRTGGESRLSNFLLYQSAYSELFFTDVFFPAFRKIDFLRIIRAYQQRARRFGK